MELYKNIYLLVIIYLQYLHAAPIIPSDNTTIIATDDDVEVDGEGDEIADILKASNFTTTELRSDRLNHSSPFGLNSNRHFNLLLWISVDSWANYLLFKQETCRNMTEDLPDLNDPDFYQTGYYQWEEYNFHKQLRILLFPETRQGPLYSKLSQDVMDSLDKRLLQIPPATYCNERPAELVLPEKEIDLFEDQILNRGYPSKYHLKVDKEEIRYEIDFAKIE